MRISINKIFNAIIVLGFASTLSMPVMAEETTERTSRSISYDSKTELSEEGRTTRLKVADIELSKTLVKEGTRKETKLGSRYVENINYQQGDFTIYDSWTELISDFDYDGFYHRFSVTIDADTVFESANVYAVLYLSYEGGPWNYYATSNVYTIYVDSEFDTFTVETELADGFPAGYYDVRVELYDADYDEWLDTSGPYDDGSLSTLPLEDSYADDGVYYDDVSSTEVYVSGTATGSMGLWLTGLLPLTGLIRKLTAATNESRL